MKKIYILLISTFSFTQLYSQALPNPGFENWTTQGGYDDPDNWNTLNSLTVGLGAITAQKATGADVHTGAAAIKLVTLSVLGQNANGLVTTGTINVAAQTVDGGIPYTLRPDSITGWYKCSPQGTDYGFVDFTLFDAAGTDTIGFAHFQTPNSAVTTFTRFSIAINYHNANTPAISRCVISSSAGVTSQVNSMLIVDDLALIINGNGILEDMVPKNTVHYNSTNHKLHVVAQESGMISVTDMTGKKVFESAVENGDSEFALETLPAGIYIYTFSGNSTGHSSDGKFIAK